MKQQFFIKRSKRSSLFKLFTIVNTKNKIWRKIEQINKKESCNINIVNSKITSDVEVKIEELSIKSTSILEKFLNYEVWKRKTKKWKK